MKAGLDERPFIFRTQVHEVIKCVTYRLGHINFYASVKVFQQIDAIEIIRQSFLRNSSLSFRRYNCEMYFLNIRFIEYPLKVFCEQIDIVFGKWLGPNAMQDLSLYWIFKEFQIFNWNFQQMIRTGYNIAKVFSLKIILTIGAFWNQLLLLELDKHLKSIVFECLSEDSCHLQPIELHIDIPR